jgi:glutamine synthetase
MVEEGAVIGLKQRIPDRWAAAIDRFEKAKVLPEYLGREYCKCYVINRREEERNFDNVISDVDFDWYLRAV